MSLSPFDSFQSRFVTYLLNFPRTKWRGLLSVTLLLPLPCTKNRKGYEYLPMLLQPKQSCCNVHSCCLVWVGANLWPVGRKKLLDAMGLYF